MRFDIKLWLFSIAFLLLATAPQQVSAGSWSQMSSPVNSTLHSVWGRSASDVYAVGNGTVLHYDGLGWSVDTDFNVLWNGANATNSTPDVVVHDVWGDASNVFVAVGHNTTIPRYNGGVWSNTTSATGMPTHAVWVTPDGGTFGVFASGWNSTIQEFNGIFWLQKTTPQKEADYNDLWGLSYNQVWAVSSNSIYENGTNATVVGAYFNGATWSNRTLSGAPAGAFAMLNAVYGESINAIHAAGMANGSNGTAAAIFTYSTGGGSWLINGTSPYNDGALFGIWSVGGRAWAVGENGTIVRYDAPSAWNSTRFTYNNTFEGPDNGTAYTQNGYHLNGVWGTNSSNFLKIFAVGEGGGDPPVH